MTSKCTTSFGFGWKSCRPHLLRMLRRHRQSTKIRIGVWRPGLAATSRSSLRRLAASARSDARGPPTGAARTLKGMGATGAARTLKGMKLGVLADVLPFVFNTIDPAALSIKKLFC